MTRSASPARIRGALVAALVSLIWLIAPAPSASAAPAARPTPHPQLAVTGAALIDAATGRLLYGVRPNAELAIASTTKLMTALITLEHVHNLSTIFTQNDWVAAPGDSQIGLVPGERMSVHDLLEAMMLPSADDAAEDLAYNVGHHSVARFIAMMNAQARALHLTHTHYSTPIGLDTPGNYSSPLDLDLLADYDRDHYRVFRRIVDTRSAVLRAGASSLYVVNLNDLLDRYRWINGVKTGHTDDAGYVLVVSATRWGMTLIGSVLGTASEAARDDNALALLDYGFAAFHLDRAIRSHQVLARLPEQDSSRRIPVIAIRPFKRVVAKTARVHVVLRLPKQLSGPLPRHAVVGEALIYVGRHLVGRDRLIVTQAVPAVSPVSKAAHLLARPSTLLWLLLAAACALALTVRRRRRKRPVRGPVEER